MVPHGNILDNLLFCITFLTQALILPSAVHTSLADCWTTIRWRYPRATRPRLSMNAAMTILVGSRMIPGDVGTLVRRGCQNSQFTVRYRPAAQGPHKALNSHANDYRTPSSTTNLLLTTLMTDTILSPTSSLTRPSKRTSPWKAIQLRW